MFLIFSSFFSISSTLSLFFNILSASSLFWIWLLSFWHVTTILVGKWVILTALSVVLTPCPPLPLDLNTSIFKSSSFITIFTSSLISGVTKTEANEAAKPTLTTKQETKTLETE